MLNETSLKISRDPNDFERFVVERIGILKQNSGQCAGKYTMRLPAPNGRYRKHEKGKQYDIIEKL
jgi:hypothetical protein